MYFLVSQKRPHNHLNLIIALNYNTNIYHYFLGKYSYLMTASATKSLGETRKETTNVLISLIQVTDCYYILLCVCEREREILHFISVVFSMF